MNLELIKNIRVKWIHSLFEISHTQKQIEISSKRNHPSD